MIENLRTLKNSDFLKSLTEKLKAKKITIDDVSRVAGVKTVRGVPMQMFSLVLSDSQEVDLLVNDGIVQYVSIDDKTVQDYDDDNMEKMPTLLADIIAKRSIVKTKQELFKDIDVEKISKTTEENRTEEINQLKSKIETKKKNITFLQSKLNINTTNI